MAHYKRRRPRTARTKGYSSNGLAYRLGLQKEELRAMRNWPRRHDKIHHIRPCRHAAHRLEALAPCGEDEAEVADVSWPSGRKPHVYYW